MLVAVAAACGGSGSSTQDEVNPDTGETYKVASGSNYYWQGPGGDVVGTDTSDPPGYDMKPLGDVPLNGGS